MKARGMKGGANEANRHTSLKEMVGYGRNSVQRVAKETSGVDSEGKEKSAIDSSRFCHRRIIRWYPQQSDRQANREPENLKFTDLTFTRGNTLKRNDKTTS